jgi:hypothetical protein
MIIGMNPMEVSSYLPISPIMEEVENAIELKNHKSVSSTVKIWW